MSFQAYLDNAERATGRTPQQIVDLAHLRGFGPATGTAELLTWLKDELGLGRGHGMALVHVIKKGPRIADTHVGSRGVHSDENDLLRLDGLGAR